ncbi:hypothetical protein LCGC14_1605970 [marine sediment metagenome]|uniref:Uncharacterized protein n=1 Tax=marine sediment metagenome TaxID=412755 RepID=A0A0F9KQH1_9ZZZZ
MKRLFIIPLLALLIPIMAQAQNTVPISVVTAAKKLTAENAIGNPVASFVLNNFGPDTVEFKLDVLVDSTNADSANVRFELEWNGWRFSNTTMNVNSNNVFYWPDSSSKLPAGSGLPDSLFYFVWTNPLNEGERFEASNLPLTEPQRDTWTGAEVVINHAEADKHDGVSYSIGVDSSLTGANDTLEISITTPSTDVRLHLTFEARVTADCLFYIKTGITVSVAADTVTAVNDDYGSAKTATAVFIKAPRTSNTGTLVHAAELITASFQGGGVSREVDEIILARNTVYVIGIHTTAATTASIFLHFSELFSPEFGG